MEARHAAFRANKRRYFRQGRGFSNFTTVIYHARDVTGKARALASAAKVAADSAPLRTSILMTKSMMIFAAFRDHTNFDEQRRDIVHWRHITSGHAATSFTPAFDFRQSAMLSLSSTRRASPRPRRRREGGGQRDARRLRRAEKRFR